MCLFHFIKEDHAVRLSANGLCQLSAFFIAHIAGRRADQPGHRKLFHILGHIDPDQIVFIIKQCLRQRFGQLCFADTGGTKEQERANGAVRVLNTGTAALNCFCNRLYRFILPHNPLVECFIQMQ